MSGRRGFRRFFGRAPVAQVLDPPGYRLPPRVVPPPPAPAPAAAPPPTPQPRHKPKVRLVMADGTVAELPVDEDLEERAAYLVRSMLPPAPPPPPPSGGAVPPPA